MVIVTWRTSGYQGMDPEFFPWIRVIFMPILSRQERWTRWKLSIQSVGSLIVDGSKVWAHWPQSKYQGWDFGIPGSSPVQLSNIPTLPNGRMLWNPRQTKIKSAATGQVVFQLPERFAKPVDVQCDGFYLVAGYESGEILIVDLRPILL
jgi:hypothetical protein